MTLSAPRALSNIHQVGGIRTGTLDHPQPMGGQSCRVAFVDTGSGLRFIVALDRGGDIVDAFFNQYALTHLSANGYVPPSHAYHRGDDWLRSWPCGLLTTCGPRSIGQPRHEDGEDVPLHGHHSNTPAAVEMVLNPDPDPAKGKREMLLSLVVRDSRFYGPHVEVRRQIQCALGVPEIVLHDQVINRGDRRVAHNWLYHVNFGWPLLASTSRFVYRGRLDAAWGMDEAPDAATLAAVKRVPADDPAHSGESSRGIILDPAPDAEGRCHVGIVNDRLALAVELAYDLEHLPRLANWQHYSRGGCYVSGIEPFSGSLRGKARDKHPLAEQWLEPGQSRRYQLTLRVHSTAEAIAAMDGHDGAVLPR